MKRVLSAIIAVLILTAAFTSCSSGRTVKFVPEKYDGDEADIDYSNEIGVSLAGCGGIEDAFLKSAAVYAKNKNYSLRTEYAGMDAQKQSEDILSFMESGITSVIINPTDADAIGAAVDECAEAGMKIINILSPINAKTDCLIAPDYLDVGRRGAKLAKEAKKDNGFEELNVLLLESEADGFVRQLIHDGFVSELGEDGNIIGIKNFERGQEISEGLIDSEISRANVIFAWNEEILGAVLEKGASAVIICCGASADTVNGVSEQKIYASIFYGADRLAEAAVEQAVNCAEDAYYDPPEYTELALGVLSRSSVENEYAGAEDYPNPAN